MSVGTLNKQYILSVVIPTKNRQYYCINAIKQILDVTGGKAEIIVQDNSDVPSLEEQIKALDSSDVVYHYSSGILSFVDNFDYALRLASGKYVMIIGDDDGITSMALQLANWADQNDFMAVKPALSFIYFWPDSKVFKDNDNGVLDIYSFSGKIREYVSLPGVQKTLANSCQNYLDNDVIRLYHGIVRRDLLEKIQRKTGKYVGGLSPDIYLSMALSILNDNGKVVEVDIPATISGICKGSGSSQSATGEHTGKLEDAPHFRGHDNYEWDSRVPKFYSVDTIWADSALAAIKDLAPEYLEYYRMETLVYRSLRKYPSFKDVIMQCYIDNGGKKLKLLSYIASRVVDKARQKIRGQAQSIQPSTFRELATINEASHKCETWLQENKEFLALLEQDQSKEY